MSDDKKKWSDKQKRCYQRMMTLLLYWQSHNYKIIRLDLTSSNESDAEKLRYNHRQLRRMVEVKYGYKNIEDFVVETTEGNGVLHILWAWRPPSGFAQKDLFIGKRWLSRKWQQLHKAKITHIQRYRIEEIGSRKRVSRYLVSQYLSDQGSAFVRYSYSWRRSIGYPIAKLWQLFKKYHFNYLGMRDMKKLIERWERFLMGERLEGRDGPMIRIDEAKYYL